MLSEWEHSRRSSRLGIQVAVDIWILIPALLSDAIALIKGMGKGDFRVGHARDVPTLVR